ncbi:MAG: transcriptional regulator [Acidimicrobiaceae bacterium]|nr:transcriptional regulator [Acidimicrobiaceae bacterium]
MNDQGSPAGHGVALDETIHQPTRLRIMTLLVSVPEPDRLAYGFIQQTLGLTGGNQTIHLRKLEAAGFLTITKEFEGAKPRTWLQATRAGRKAYTEYLSNLEKAIGLRVHGRVQDDGQPGGQPGGQPT